MENSTKEILQSELISKIALGETLLLKLSVFHHVEGISKLQKKIRQEINFLSKVIHQTIKKEHLMCTNLHHFSALVSYLETCDDCNAVLQNFSFHYKPTTCEDEDSSNESDSEEVPFGAVIEEGPSRINVDLVTRQKQRWVKVIARNPRALSQLSVGAGKYGQKTVLDQADQFVQCAKQHLVLYQPPEVVFAFSNGIEETLARLLESRGVIVEGERVPDSNNWEEHETALSSTNLMPQSDGLNTVERLNLDVSTLVAYVSALTNGHCNFVFQQPLLTQQAEWERARPVKPVLDQIFEGKQLFCCESAIRDFSTIVNTMGGPGEKERTAALLARVKIVADQCSDRAEALSLSGKIKRRAQLIFGTGDALRAVTVSANEGFIRGARNQGLEFAVFLHESRALSEIKEQQARPLSDTD